VPGKVALVYDDAYGAYRHADWHPLQPRRVKLAFELIQQTGLGAHAELLQPRQAADEELSLVHSPDYVELVKRLGHGDQLTRADLFQAAAAGFASEDNPVFPDMHEASALIAGGSLVAAEAVESGRAAHAFNPAGGLHHAMREMASGFCVYNDVAVAVAWLRRQGHRVAVVDVDVHHGDGTQASFYSDPEVLTISLHQLSRGFFPGTGFPQETGAGPAAGTSINVPYPPETWDEPWLRGFEEVVPALLRQFKPSVLVTQDGCDTHLLDPLASLRCSTRIFPHLGRRFHDLAHELCEGRWVALGGGGYAVEEVVPRAWTLLFAEMVEHPELAAHLNDAHAFPPDPETQELVWPAVERSLRALDAALELSRDQLA
jgi:acetoin utilization protein AcuC